MTTMLKDRKKKFSHRKRNWILRHCEGFSLNEVIIVMVIIGVLAAIGIPSFLQWLPNIRLKSAGRDIFATMQDAKIGAIKENREWAVFFNDNAGSANDTYTIFNSSGDGDWTTPGDNIPVRTIELASYKSGITFGHGDATSPQGGSYDGGDGDHVSYNNNYVKFTPRGIASAGYVYLENEQGTTLAIGTLTSGVIRFFQWKGTWQ